MPIKFMRPDGYARRPRAPRRRREPPAQHDLAPGQASLAEQERAERRRLAERYQCPSCHAPIGQPCTRRPRPGECGKRVPLGFMCHAERHALADRETGER